MQRLVRGAVAWSASVVPVIVVMSLLSEGASGSLGNVDRLPLNGLGWALLVMPVPLVLVARTWGQASRPALVVPALALDLGIVALGASPSVLFAPAALAVTVAALARRD